MTTVARTEVARCPTCQHRIMFHVLDGIHTLDGCRCIVAAGIPCPCTATRQELLR